MSVFLLEPQNCSEVVCPVGGLAMQPNVLTMPGRQTAPDYAREAGTSFCTPQWFVFIHKGMGGESLPVKYCEVCG